MSGHDIVHYLDDFRHAMAFAWAYSTWIGGLTSAAIIFFLASVLWPRIRLFIYRLIKPPIDDLKHHITKEQQKLHEGIESLRQSHEAIVESHNKMLAKLNGQEDDVGS